MRTPRPSLYLALCCYAIVLGLPGGEAPPKPVFEPGTDPAAAAKPKRDPGRRGQGQGQGQGQGGAGAKTAAPTAPQPPPPLVAQTPPPPPSQPAPSPEENLDKDTIILDNDQRFLGTVLAVQPDPAWVAINTGNGILRLPRERIVKVEFGLVARMGQIKSDDLAALSDLARWCRAAGRNAEAMQLASKAVTLRGCDLATRGLYAQLVDELEGPDKALPLYIAYRNGGGKDAEILARLAELEKAHKAWEEQMRSLGLDPGTGGALATASPVEEGLEKHRWEAGNPSWSAVAKPTMVTITTEQGPRRVLQIDVEPHPSNNSIDKAVVVLTRQQSLSPGTRLSFLAANRGTDELRVGIAVKTGAWVYYESKPQVLPATSTGQEFTQLTFDLAASDFKSEATKWAYSSPVKDLANLREVQILVHNGRRSGSLWVAGIAFEGR